MDFMYLYDIIFAGGMTFHKMSLVEDTTKKLSGKNQDTSVMPLRKPNLFN